jgi:taurine dioxygenase
LVSEIEDLPTDEARRLVEEIEAFATQPRFVYRHKWQQGDLLIWDNRCTLHRATPFPDEYRRVMHRTQVKGDKPFFAP